MRYMKFVAYRGAWLFALVACVALPGRTQAIAPEPAAASAEIIPSTAGETPAETPEYVVGVGDVLRITVWKEAEISQPSLVVRPDGMISLPLVGMLKVGGLSPSQIQDVVTAKLTRFLSKPQVTVTVTDIRSKSVYITGEVAKPGVYPLLAPTDILQLIVMAGGTTPFAHRKSIFVLRTVDGQQQKLPVNYAKLLRGKDADRNITLLPGDTVVVP